MDSMKFVVGDTTLKVDLSQVTLSYDVDDMIKEIDSKCDHIMKMINFQHHEHLYLLQIVS